MLRFIGTFPSLPSSAQLGDVCVVNSTTYVYVSSTWMEMGDIHNPDIDINIKYSINLETQTLDIKSNF